jgi:PKD repeat protein
MKIPCIHLLREGQPKRLLAYMAAPVLLMGSLSVSAEPPTASFTVTPAEGIAPLTVNINASGSSSGAHIKYWWAFFPGGNLEAGANTHSKTFNAEGTHSIVLIVENDNGEVGVVSKSVVVTPPPINQPPVANFTHTVNDLTVTLDGSASTDDGGIVKFEWSSNNGKTATGKNASLIFDNEGSYEITLTVTDNQGESSSSTPQTVTVTAPNKPPVADFTPTVADDYITVNLDGNASSDEDGNIVTYAWKASDGQTANGLNTSLIFQQIGDYQITLTVKDDDGATSFIDKTVTIVPPPPDYNTTARFAPQIIAAGVSPSQVDMSDTQFNIVALVRPGTSRIRTVTFKDTAGTFSPAMNPVGVLANGDEFYQFTYTYAPGTFSKGDLIETAWGSQTGQFNIIAVSEGNESSQTYPYLKIGTYTAIDNNKGRKPATPLTYDTTRRYGGPQVIMAGYSPAVLDKNDSEFDVIAVLRPGSVPLGSVTLKQGSGPFQAGISLAGELDNGDKMYKFTYLFEPGALGNPETGFIEIKDLWGSTAEQFAIEVTDQAGMKSHKFPNIEFGYFPEYKSEE